MSLLIVGSIALDTIQTPFGKVEDELGGSATYASLAAQLYTQCSIVGVLGNDFPKENLNLFNKYKIDTSGLQVKKGSTFRWVGEYSFDLNNAKTKSTCLGVFEDFQPTEFKNFDKFSIVFLANIDPELQLSVIKKTAVNSPFLALDTMNYWIENRREKLADAISEVDLVFMNEAEIRQYSGDYNLIHAAKKVLKQGPKYVIVKQGEYGCIVFSENSIFNTPSFLLEKLKDPTGAGDSFAGGVLGYLSSYFANLEKYEEKPNYKDVFSFETIKSAVLQGNILASFTVEDFGPRKLLSLDQTMLDERYKEFEDLTRY